MTPPPDALTLLRRLYEILVTTDVPDPWRVECDLHGITECPDLLAELGVVLLECHRVLFPARAA